MKETGNTIGRKKLIWRFVILGIFGILLVLFNLLKSDRKVMTFLARNAAKPFRGFLARLCSFTEWSCAEWFLAAAAVAALSIVIVSVINAVRAGKSWYIPALGGLLLITDIAVILWFILCFNWNCGYYAETFAESAGIEVEDSTVEELASVTEFFAMQVNEHAVKVHRDEDGIFRIDLDAVLDRSPALYEKISNEYSVLEGPGLRVKKTRLARVMSMITTTGYLFPYTGEANINIDMPDCFIPVTVAHEISHQRGVASEQEANFVAILVSVGSKDEDFQYSGWLFGFTYLSNALYKADRDEWLRIRSSICEQANADLADDTVYWERYEKTRTAESSDKLYDSYLKHNGQDLGRQSYGAVVDLLIAYYK